ncbi:MAG: DUF934 domain-containing protein [Azonexus sp.]
MARLIKNKQIVADTWLTLEPGENDTAESLALPAGDVIFPLAVWQARKDEILARGGRIGLLLKGEDPVEAVAADVGRFAVIAIQFAKFVDGRGYSTASLLRQRYGYSGELRAVGDILHDQLFFLARVGFDAYALRDDKDAAYAIEKGFSVFSNNYQASTSQPQPLFRRRA